MRKSRNYPKRLYPIATDDIYIESGSPEELAELYRLDAKGIYKKIKKIIDSKSFREE